MTLRSLCSMINAHGENIKRETESIEVSAWLIGQYVAHAINCTFGKGSYPDSPLKQKQEIIISDDMSEEDKIEMTKRLFNNLKIMQANYEFSKGGS